MIREAPLTLTAEILGHRLSSAVDHAGATATLVIDVPDAPVWWPVGYGEQPLADLTLMLSAAGERTRSVAAKGGFPNASNWTPPADEIGTAFTISVNGRPVFVKGVNWIPDDHFLTRITAERLERRLDQAVAANVNLVRVWGGGIFESEDFYRGLRRARTAGLAGLPAGLRRVSGRVAAVGGDRSRGPGERRTAGTAPVAGAVQRRQ